MDERTDVAESSAACETSMDPSGLPIIKLIGELDIGCADAIRTAVNAFVSDPPARVVIDLSELRFMDSSGLSVLLLVADRVGEVELREPSAMIRKLIELTGLSSVFVITP